jgi:fluoroquinolone transport system ATP-binding protein
VDGLSCEVGQGEVFGFLGPSGAGKSTTQKALTFLLVGWEGSISVLGMDPGRTPRVFYERIGGFVRVS